MRSLKIIAVLSLSSSLLSCIGDECTYDKVESQMPVSGIDCPSGDLCYLGQCFRGCNPGAERLELCGTNDDCKNGSRPNCIFADSLAGSFCSTCDEGQACVLGLNICQSVAEIPDPEQPERVMSNVPLPQDGGQIDATSFEDAGSGEPMIENVTYNGYVELSQQRRFESGGGPAALVAAEFCDVIMTATKAVDVVLSERQTCELHRVLPYEGPVLAANLGTVRYAPDEETPEALAVPEIIGTFNGVSGRYEFTPPLPPQLFKYSVPPQSSYQYAVLDVSGGPAGVWPESADEQKALVPFAFELDEATEMFMSMSPIEMSISSPLDLELGWVLTPLEVREDEVQGERIALEIGYNRSVCRNTGPEPQFYIRCTQSEDDVFGDAVITVPADLIDELRFNLDAQPGETLSVRFGRVQARRYSFGNDETMVYGEVLSYFGDETTTTLRWEP